MEDLPHDVLAHIFVRYLTFREHKLAISAVSRRLRRAALDMPLLWSSIDIYGSRDLAYLELYLERSKDALLDVSVLPYGHNLVVEWRVAPMPFDSDRVVGALLPHAARLRSLTVYLYNLGPMAPLLCENLVLEHLQQLVVYGSGISEEIAIALSAPQLRTLELSSCAAHAIPRIAPALTDLTVVLGFSTDMQAFMDDLVANAARTMRTLTLSQGSHSDKVAPLIGPWTFPHLQYLNLRFSASRAVEMLRCMPVAHIPYVHVGVAVPPNRERDYPRFVYPVIESLLLWTENLASFSIVGQYACEMASSSGQQRVLDVPTYEPEQLLLRVWDYLCDHFSAHNGVTSCSLDTSMWHLYEAAFAGRAPAGPEFTLSVSATYLSERLSPLMFPTLARVVLMGNRPVHPRMRVLDFELAHYQRVVLWLARGALQCSRVDVELCTCRIPELSDWGILNALRGWVEEERLPGGCLSADAGCVIRWILCSGNYNI